MSLFNFVKEAGEKLLGLDDEEPEAPAVPETPEIKPAGANTSAATLHLMLSKYDQRLTTSASVLLTAS